MINAPQTASSQIPATKDERRQTISNRLQKETEELQARPRDQDEEVDLEYHERIIKRLGKEKEQVPPVAPIPYTPLAAPASRVPPQEGEQEGMMEDPRLSKIYEEDEEEDE